MRSRRWLICLLVGLWLWILWPAGSALQAAEARGSGDYLDGLNALASGKLDDALVSFRRAIAADDENASYHTACAITWYLKEKPNDAADSIDRAMKLGPTPATQLWSWAINTVLSVAPPDDLDPAARQRAAQRQRQIEFGARPPYESPEPYARPFIEAAMAYATPQDPAARQQTRAKLLDAGVQFAWREMSGPGLAPSLKAQAKRLYDQQKYAEALALIDRLRTSDVANGNDPELLYYSAGCKGFLGDFQASREEYTQVLRSWPQHCNSFLGRARAAANMGSMQRASRDLEIAASIDPKATEAYKAQIAKQIEDGAKRVPPGSPAELLDALKKAVADNEPMAALVDKAEKLERAYFATRFNRDETFTEEHQRLDAAAKADPSSADKLAALGAFLVNPTAIIPVRLPGQTGTCRVPLGDEDLVHAEPALNAALVINPNHVNALTQKAIAAAQRKQPEEAIGYVKRAFAANGANLDLVRLHLVYYTNQADNLAAQAYQLRQPKITYETRDNKEYRVTTYPSPADLARADQLDKQSDELRRVAAAPLQKFIEANPKTVDGKVAAAEFARWRGKYDEALANLDAALAIDKWNLDAHEFYIDLCPKIGMMDKAIEHQNLLNNLTNPSAGRTLDKVWELLAATKYRSSRGVIDEAEKIDPASSYVPAYRSTVALAEKKTDDAIASIKQAVCMEEGRQRVFGRTLNVDVTTPLRADDVALTMILRQLWGMSLMLEQNKPAEAADQFKRVSLLGRRVPPAQWNDPVQASALPTPGNQQPKGWTIKQMVMGSQLQGSKALLAANKPEESAKSLLAYISTNDSSDLPPGALDFGYQIYQKLGPEKAQRVFPQNLLMHYQMLDGQAENRQILQRGDDIEKKYQDKFADLDARRAKLAEQMRSAQLARDNQKLRALMQQQQALDQEYQQLRIQMNQEQMRNIDPNNSPNGGNGGYNPANNPNAR